MSESSAKALIATGQVILNSETTLDLGEKVDRFSEVVCSGEVIQSGTPRIYLMMNKPVGYLSATTDRQHPTVLDLIDHRCKGTLHIAGRLDRSSTGLLLLTNDSAWSENLTRPDSKVAKVYRVETVNPILEDAVQKFADGFYFASEDIVTKPARLEILAPREARVTIYEGKYHQIKRMFHRIDENRLVSLHRERIGAYFLPNDLQAGEWREFEPPANPIATAGDDPR